MSYQSPYNSQRDYLASQRASYKPYPYRSGLNINQSVSQILPQRSSYTQFPINASTSKYASPQGNSRLINTMSLEQDLQGLQERYNAEHEEKQKSYEMNLQQHVKLGTTIKDLESRLNEEARTVAILDDRLKGRDRELDEEKRIRIDYETQNISLAEHLRRATENNTDLQFKLSDLDQHYKKLQAESDSKGLEILRLKEEHAKQMQDMEAFYLNQIQNLQVDNDQLRVAGERLTTDYNAHIRSVTTEMTKKCDHVEDLARERAKKLNDMENEIKGLHDYIDKLKSNFELDIKRERATGKEEEKNHWYGITKDLEDNIRALEMEKDHVHKKNYDLIREVEHRDRNLMQVKTYFDEELNRAKNELIDVKRLLDTTTNGLERAKADIITKESHIRRVEAENIQLRKEVDRVKEVNQHEINRLVSNQGIENRRWEDIERNLKERNAELEKCLRISEEDGLKLRHDIDRLRENLVGNVNKSLMQTYVDYKNFSTTSRSHLL